MWKKRDVVRAGCAILVTLAGWVLIRLAFPLLDYYPPESLVRDLGPSWIATAGIRQPVKVGYATVALDVVSPLLRGRDRRRAARGAARRPDGRGRRARGRARLRMARSCRSPVRIAG